jgi:glutamate synthase (NADPH/NADH) small chain
MTEKNPTSKTARSAKIRLFSQPVASRTTEERVRDFGPIMLSFDEAGAKAEADRCIGCPRQPCVEACPFSNDIPTAMRYISEGQFLEAAAVYQATSTLPEICSRVCPQESLCEGACVLGKRGHAVALGALEQFVMDYAHAHANQSLHAPRPAPTNKSVAIIGTGPAGLSAAQRLLEKGHAVTLYEAWPHPGGWLTYAVPTYKLPRSYVDGKIAQLKNLGAQFMLNTRIGVDVPFSDLREQHDAVFIAVGAMLDAQIDLPGRDLPGVYTGTDFLLPIYTPSALYPGETESPVIGAQVVVFGGGDTAMDCVRTAVRLQVQAGITPDVTLIYRRTENEMPASSKERKAAVEEGVKFVYLAAPVAFHSGSDGRVKEAVVQRMQLGEPDSSGRRRPVPIDGSEYTVPAGTAVLALGYWPDPLISAHVPELDTQKWGLIITNVDTAETNLPGVFAGGDAVRGPALASYAAHDGIVAAQAIHDYLAIK